MPINLQVDYMRHLLQRNGVKAVVTEISREEAMNPPKAEDTGYRAAASTGKRDGR